MFGVIGCTPAIEKDGNYQFVTCEVTGWQGIWSCQEIESLTVLWEEHADAHDHHQATKDRTHNARLALDSARRIYRTTEPGDPARRGIGSLL